jgi:hypothetical protein
VPATTTDRSDERHAEAAGSVESHIGSPTPSLLVLHPGAPQQHSQIRRPRQTLGKRPQPSIYGMDCVGRFGVDRSRLSRVAVTVAVRSLRPRAAGPSVTRRPPRPRHAAPTLIDDRGAGVESSPHVDASSSHVERSSRMTTPRSGSMWGDEAERSRRLRSFVDTHLKCSLTCANRPGTMVVPDGRWWSTSTLVRAD